MNPDKLHFHIVIDEWALNVESNLDSVLTTLTSSDLLKQADIVSEFKQTFLHEGWQTFMKDLIPKEIEHIFPLTLGHNDILDGNILMNTQDNRQLLIIDYEYTNWSPMGTDIAKYFNEVMMDHQSRNGIVCYLDNMLTYTELKQVCRAYLTRYY